MAPFRASRATRSGRPGGPVDENVFLDGLPVRQWRQQETTVGAATDPYGISAPGEKGSGAGISAWPQHGMPKGSETYPPFLQQALRGMRNGYLPQMSWENGKNGGNTSGSSRTTRVEDESEENDEAEGHTAEGVSKSGSKITALQQGFTAKRWVQIPRDSEEPEREYLAKKRKGIGATFGTDLNGVSVPVTSAVPMRKTKVRKMDAQGNPTVFEVLVAEGQTVEGEITESLTLENAAAAIVTPAPGTYVEGVGVANQDGVVVANEVVVAPVRRKPPPPRRKPKRGPGRGHKKIVVPDGESNAPSTDGNATSEAGDANGGNLEGGEADDHKDGDDDEDDEGEDSEDGEEGEGEDREMSEATTPNEQEESETPEPSVQVREPHSEHPLRQVETIADDEPAMDIDPPQSSKAEDFESMVKEPSPPQVTETITPQPERTPTPSAVEPPTGETLSQPVDRPAPEHIAIPEQRLETPPRQPLEEEQHHEQEPQSPERPELEEFTPPTPPAPAYEPLSQVSSYDQGPPSQPVDILETAAKSPAERVAEAIPGDLASANNHRADATAETSVDTAAVEPHGIVIEEGPPHSVGTAAPELEIVEPHSEAVYVESQPEKPAEQPPESKDHEQLPPESSKPGSAA